MSTTKKTATAVKKETEVKAATVVAKAPVAETKAAAEVKAEEKAVKAPVAKKAVEKKETKKATTAKKTPVAKASKVDVKIAVQYAGKSYTSDELVKIANDVWKYDCGKEASELKDVQLYVKPEESKVYYVFNNEIAGDFLI